MIKIIGYFPKIRYVSGAPNIKFNEQSDKQSDLIREYEKEHPDDFVWGVVRSAGTTVYAQPRSELKKQTAWDEINYCKEKGIIHKDYPDDDRVLVRHNNHGFHYGKHEFDK